MAHIGAYEAKTRLATLLDQVEAGEVVTITRHGVPIARLVPVREPSAPAVTETIARLRAFRRGKRLRGFDPAALVREGRR